MTKQYTFLPALPRQAAEKSCGCGPNCRCGSNCACGPNGKCAPTCTCAN